ncbi:hypothetical protein [Citricoccus sp. NR2]|nr:hypothetical protein [Citricoccus sp. NR2]WBL20278.1 hypothetical protein O1A05_06235 [Citricoccus sp. NR2]
MLELDWSGTRGRAGGPPVAADQQLAAISVLLAGFAPVTCSPR